MRPGCHYVIGEPGPGSGMIPVCPGHGSPLMLVLATPTILAGDVTSLVLDCPMGDNDAGAATVREYLVKLLAEVWTERECFNGMRPFGNSGWEYEVYAALIAADLVTGVLDEDGYIDDVDHGTASRLVSDAIASLGVKP